MINRHAYHILAHNEPKVLQTLVEMIDDERNDIYIYLNKKNDLNVFLLSIRSMIHEKARFGLQNLN